MDSTLAKYASRAVPRYTSYPPANHWLAQDEAFARQAFGRSDGRPLSLYVHVPFCKHLCFYCGCNMQVSRSAPLYERYLAALEVEAGRVAGALGTAGPVVQLHLGGGTPTVLDEAQLTRLVTGLKRSFSFDREIEASIEVHPPVTTAAQLGTLARLGFTRISMGVQDFDPKVQQRINRPQPFEQTFELVQQARQLGFVSVNLDLMYGLPLQTPDSFAKTLEHIEQMRPDRVALFGYAHMPSLKKHMRLIDAAELPNSEQRLELFTGAVEAMRAMGYVAIGLDHFALESDELCTAREQGTLRRNFMGYTTCAQTDVIALGPSSISEVGGAFLQNARAMHGWADRIEAGGLAVDRGWANDRDDQLRADVIQHLFCDLEIDAAQLSARHGIDFSQAFARELADADELVRDGLLERQGTRLLVTPLGRLLLRNVAAVFDGYLRKSAARPHSLAV